tara:strand:- start:272 stop:1465 length:1194 start_codon:yes stop_codon:yes gene_type:complete
MKKTIILLLIVLFYAPLSYSENYNVFYAGFSFSGNYSDKLQTSKYTDKILNIKNENGLDVISASLLHSIKKVKPPNYSMQYDLADLDEGSKESIVMSVALDHESYSTEYFPATKTYANFIDMYFQVLFYNFDSKKLIASIPFDVEISTLSKAPLKQADIEKLIQRFYSDGLKSETGKTINAFHNLENILNNFVLKDKYRFRIGVTDVILEEKANNHIPVNLRKNLSAVKNMFAQSLSSRLSLHQSISLVPYQEGMAIGGSMKQRFANSDEIYDIQLPTPDFNIILTVRGFKKVLGKTSDVNEIYLYGAYTNIKILQPDLQKIYFNEKLKNATQVTMPKDLKGVDDWRKFHYSLVSLFDKFSINITNPSQKYMKFQSKDPNNLKNKMDSVKTVLNKVR